MTDTNTTNTATKKEQVLRVYPVTIDGKVRNIEASSPAAAITHAFKPLIGRPLSGGEVSALIRKGEKIESAVTA